MLASLLGEPGFEVTLAGSGQQAAEQLKSLTTLDLVITDQFMDDGDGWRVLEAANEAWPGVPMLLLSAYYLYSDHYQACYAGLSG